MDINFLRGLITIVLIMMFLGLCVWVYHPKREKSFEKSSRLPLIDEEEYTNE